MHQLARFVKKYAKNLAGGEIIGLVGNLGAGKQQFTLNTDVLSKGVYNVVINNEGSRTIKKLIVE